MFGVTVVRLYPRRLPDGTEAPGLSCDDGGVVLGGHASLISRECDSTGKATYRARHVSEINFVLSAAYGVQIDFGGRMSLLKRIADCLGQGDLSSACIAALQLRLPELSNSNAVSRLKKAEALLAAPLSPIPRVTFTGRARCSCIRQSARRKRDVSNEPRIPKGQSGGGQWTADGDARATAQMTSPDNLLVPAQMAPPMPWVRPAPLPWTLPAPPTEISPFLDIPGDALDPGKPLRNPFPRSERCVEEWDHAFKYCDDLEKKGLLGKGDHKESGRTYRQCVLGQVSEECGGSDLSA